MQVELVLAPNPGPFTGPGTNSWVVSSGPVAVVIDPGPIITDHVAAIERTIGARQPLAVLVTHTHPDHAPAANLLGERMSVPVLGFGPGPEFEPTTTLGDGDIVEVGDISLVAVHTPGHTPDHLCYRVADVMFTGDHIVGGSSVILEDAAAYLRSLHKVESLTPRHLYPGHGAEIAEAASAISDYIAHRLERERQVIAAVEAGATTPGQVVSIVYEDVDPALLPAATEQVEVQLAKLVADRLVALTRAADGSANYTAPRPPAGGG